MRRKISCWRDASGKLSIGGVPAYMFLIYLSWCRWPSMTTIYVCSGILTFFAIISYKGWTLKTLITRITFILQGSRKSGRPWWYRRFFE